MLRESPGARVEGGAGAGGSVDVGEQVAAAAARHDCHRDGVLCMTAVGTGMQRMLVTGGRDTAVKVWKGGRAGDDGAFDMSKQGM